jgi:redox-sensitive bicupin YhaK (pirin superfamily)
MITVRRARERGHADHGWLRSWHTFSFADYFDPAHVQFHGLRVLNEDIVAPGRGFGMHPHRDMEIITWVLAGALQHEDSMGNGSVIRPGEVQVMSAGTGVRHSEHNPSPTEPVHLLQIWIFPRARDLPPRYEQAVVEGLDGGRLGWIAGPPGSGATARIEAAARVGVVRLRPGQTVEHAVAERPHLWVQVARGEVTVNGTALHAGDGAAIEDESRLRLAGGGEASEVLVFELA